jgi:hypothetical protein
MSGKTFPASFLNGKYKSHKLYHAQRPIWIYLVIIYRFILKKIGDGYIEKENI